MMYNIKEWHFVKILIEIKELRINLINLFTCFKLYSPSKYFLAESQQKKQ